MFWADFKDEEGKTRVSSLKTGENKDEEAKTGMSSLNSGENKDERPQTGVSSSTSGPHKDGLVLLKLQAGGDDVVVAVLHGQAAGGGLLVQGREVLSGLRGGIARFPLASSMRRLPRRELR